MSEDAHPDSSGPDDPNNGTAIAEDGDVRNSSVADQAEEEEQYLPEPVKLGSGQQTFPGLGRKIPREHKVKLSSHEVPGAGEIKAEEDLLLLVRARKTGDHDKFKEDGEGRVIRVNTVHDIKPTWIEGIRDWLTGNGVKLVDAEGPGEALDPNNLVNIEQMRREQEEREDALA